MKFLKLRSGREIWELNIIADALNKFKPDSQIEDSIRQDLIQRTQSIKAIIYQEDINRKRCLNDQW